MMDNMIKTQVTDSLMDMIDDETVADVITMLSKYQADDVIQVEWSGYEEVDIYVYRTREKTESELRIDELDKAENEQLRKVRARVASDIRDLGDDIIRSQHDLADLQDMIRTAAQDEAEEVRKIQSHYAQLAETVT